MAKIDHIDLATKHIYLAAGTREFHPVENIYKEIRTLRATNPSLRGFDTPVFASGNVAKGGGKFTPRLATFRLGWKIVPEDVSHILYVSGEQITDTGEAGAACFDLTPLAPTSKVIIHYEPPLAEIVETGISGLTEEEKQKLIEISSIKAKTDNLPASPAQENTVQTVRAKTDNLPPDPTSASELAGIHGAGSWEGATSVQLWNHDDRRLSSRDIESGMPGEHLPSEYQLLTHSQEVQLALDIIKEEIKDLTDKIDKIKITGKASFRL